MNSNRDYATENINLKKRLEKLEIENRNNEKVIKDSVKLINKNLELQARLEVLKQKDKKWQELFGRDLCEVLGNELLRQQNEKLKKVIEILKDKAVNVAKLLVSFGHNEPLDYYNDGLFSFRLTQQEYELLKEVLGND